MLFYSLRFTDDEKCSQLNCTHTENTGKYHKKWNFFVWIYFCFFLYSSVRFTVCYSFYVYFSLCLSLFIFFNRLCILGTAKFTVSIIDCNSHQIWQYASQFKLLIFPYFFYYCSYSYSLFCYFRKVEIFI